MRHIRHAIVSLAFLTLITGAAYPLFVTAIAQVLFPSQANGSLIEVDGKLVGSRLIGQSFTAPRYFWGRLSATGPVPYNGAASSGSNYGPLDDRLLAASRDRVAALRSADPENRQPIPVDLASASASGLDPHISVAAAEYQVARVARARGIAEDDVRRLVREHTQKRQLGFLGEPVVTVLSLNLALDRLEATR